MGSDYDPDHYRWMDGHMDSGMGGGGWLLMIAVLLIGLAVLVAISLWVVRMTPSRAVAAPPHGAAPASRAGAILDERFARGEIDEDEYLQRRHTLLGVPPA